ncbi:33 kDa chaperonin [bioreactor metagenome]|uniref:33 kDa chaperonin n=1 Tax=bioreactor metagenome TaxID=1076179 RepID=A0A645GEL4_9ZZZZ
MGANEINSIIETDGEAEVVCQFCNKKYKLNKEELISLLFKATNKN